MTVEEGERRLLSFESFDSVAPGIAPNVVLTSLVEHCFIKEDDTARTSLLCSLMQHRKREVDKIWTEIDDE